MPDLRTRRGVELARVGRYELSTGWHEFTRDQFESIIAGASTGTPARVKIGHSDPRFDGSPSLGIVTNLRVDDDGDVLLGDLEGVPGWLDDALPHAYPGRSIEAAVRDDGTVRLQALSLLGQEAPAIDTLADLEMALAAAARTSPAGAPDVTYVAVALNQLRASAQEQAASRPLPMKEMTMDPKVQEFLKAQGLDPEAATETQQAAASVFVAAGIAPPPAVAESATDPATEPAAVEPVVEPVVEAEPVAVAAAAAPAPEVIAATHEQMTRLSTEVAELRAAAASRDALDVAARRDSIVSGWVSEGRIAHDQSGEYRKLLDIDEAGTSNIAASLKVDRIPVLQRTQNTVIASAGNADDDLLAATLDRLGVKP